MRTFITGLIVGAIAHAGISAMLRVNPETLKEPVPQSLSRAHEVAGVSTNRVDANPGLESGRALIAPPQSESHACAQVDESNLDEVLSELIARKSRARQASLDAEPKDPLWSDAMEQQIREFVSRHPSARDLVVTEVDCRTLYCQLNVSAPANGRDGRVESSQEDFQKVAEDAEKQLGLRRGESGGSSDGNAYELHVRFRRYAPGAECPPNLQKDCWNR